MDYNFHNFKPACLTDLIIFASKMFKASTLQKFE